MVLNNVIAYRAIGTDTGQFPHTHDTKFKKLFIILYRVLNQLDPFKSKYLNFLDDTYIS